MFAADLAEIYTEKYVVQPGDTLLKLSMKFHVRQQELSKANRLFDATVFPGQVLKVPQLPDDLECEKLKQKTANDIAKNNQTGTYQIDDMLT